MFKTNDVVSEQFVKILNVITSNRPIFLLKNCEKLLHSHFFSEGGYIVVKNLTVDLLTSSLG